MTSAWSELLTTFSENYILVPPIWPKLREGLTHPEPELWTTRPDVDRLDMYMFNEPVREVAMSSCEPYFAIAYAGHGTNSNTYTLNLVMRRAAIFLQFGVGPEFKNFVECRVNITRGFVFLERLIANVPEEDGEVDYIVAYSDIRGAELLRRNPSARGTSTQFAGVIDGWDSVNYLKTASSDPTGLPLDGGLFAWREPIEFELVASKFLAEMSQPSGSSKRG